MASEIAKLTAMKLKLTDVAVKKMINDNDHNEVTTM